MSLAYFKSFPAKNVCNKDMQVPRAPTGRFKVVHVHPLDLLFSFLQTTHYPCTVTGQNGIGHNGTDKMVRKQYVKDKMVAISIDFNRIELFIYLATTSYQ